MGRLNWESGALVIRRPHLPPKATPAAMAAQLLPVVVVVAQVLPEPTELATMEETEAMVRRPLLLALR